MRRLDFAEEKAEAVSQRTSDQANRSEAVRSDNRAVAAGSRDVAGCTAVNKRNI
jgi:hypothetical protein